MLSTLPKWAPIAIILGVTFLAMAIYLFVNRGDDDEDEDEDDATRLMGPGADTLDIESDETRARKSRMIALKDSLDRSLQTRTGVNAAEVDRLAMPWFMLVGTEGSGKRSLLANTGLPLPFGPPVELDHSKKDGGRWWTFDDAVVVEAPTVKPQPKSPSASEITAVEPAQGDSSENWNNLLPIRSAHDTASGRIRR